MSVYDLESRTLPPAPRVPSAAASNRIPPRGSLGLAAADKVIGQMHDTIEAAHEAVTDLIESRVEGRRWLAAEAEMMRTGDPEVLAELIEGEPLRYATAVLAARTSVARMDDLRRAGQAHLDKAADKVEEQLRELGAVFASEADVAWRERGTGRGVTALETCDRMVEEMRTLSALIAWCRGSDREYQHARGVYYLAPEAAATHRAAAMARTGNVPMELPSSFLDHRPAGWDQWVRETERRHEMQAH